MSNVRPEQIYEALFDDEAFARLPGLVAEIANARSGLMHWRQDDGSFEVMGASYFTPEMIARIPQFLPYDPWTAAGQRRPNRLWRLDQLLPPGAFERSIPYNEVCRPAGDDTNHCMGIVITTPAGAGAIAVHRGRTQVAFDEEDSARLGDNLSHITRVLRARGETAAARREALLSEAAGARLAVAMITVAADCRVLTANAAAEVVLKRQDGVTLRAGSLVALEYDASVRLRAAIAIATAAPERASSALRVGRTDGGAPYQLTVTPIVTAAGPPSAVVIFRDPDQADPTLAERMRALYSLTDAEASIAVDLGRGLSAGEIAFNREVSANTLKSQLKALAAKLGCNRQSQIAAVVAALPPLRPI